MPSHYPGDQENDFENAEFKPQTSRLMDQVKEVLRYHHYTIPTAQAM